MTGTFSPIRVLIAKPGLDGHTRGALVVKQALENSGMNVAFTGIRQTAEQIVVAAKRFNADCLGLSCLSGAHLEHVPEVMLLLRKERLQRMLVLCGGVIPEADIPVLLQAGVAAVFTSGSSTDAIAAYIREHVRQAVAQ